MIIDKDELHDYVREHLAPHKTRAIGSSSTPCR